MSFPVAEEAVEKTIDEVDDIVNPWKFQQQVLKESIMINLFVCHYSLSFSDFILYILLLH